MKFSILSGLIIFVVITGCNNSPVPSSRSKKTTTITTNAATNALDMADEDTTKGRVDTSKTNQ